MIKELPHYHVDGYYGGSQSWMKHPYMRIGGCGALTACDSCIYFAKYLEFKEYIWHWFILNGYDDEEGTVRAATYGAGEWLNFKSFWNTKEEPKGGIVLYDVK